jgi:N-acetylglucosaminyldiphosphoundecaprenol N-acetyl-beta-D-mannosaminyltransferase
MTEPAARRARTGSVPTVPTVRLLEYDVATLTLAGAIERCLDMLERPTPQLVVTLNPEIVVQARADASLAKALANADRTVADGVGILWAARQFGHHLPGRVPGVELMHGILEQGGSDVRAFFLGAKPGVAERASRVAAERYGTIVAGVRHGYFRRPDETPEVLEAVRASGANLLLAGLGEGQERFLHEHRADLGVALMIGVGGSLDVLSGEVQRTPEWTRRLGIEWAYRVGLDRKRWHRFPRLLTFVRLVRTSRTS